MNTGRKPDIYSKDHGTMEKKKIEYSDDLFFTKINSRTNKLYRSVLIDTDYKARKFTHVMNFILKEYNANPNYRVLYVVARKILVLERHVLLAEMIPSDGVVRTHEDGDSQMLVCYVGALEKLSADVQYDLVVCEEVNGIMMRFVRYLRDPTTEEAKKRQDVFKQIIDKATKRVFLDYGEQPLVKKFVTDLCPENPPDLLYYVEECRRAIASVKFIDEGIMFAKLKKFIKKGKRCIVCCGTREDAERVHRLYNSNSFPVLLVTSRTADEQRDTVLHLQQKIGNYKMIVYTSTRALNPDVCGVWADAAFSYARASPKYSSLMIQVMFALNIDSYFCKVK